MNAGMIFLLAVAILIYFGLAQRALDRLRLSDRAALLFLVAMIIGGFLPDIPLFRGVSINIGGGIVPIIRVVYLWGRAEKTEVSRSVAAMLVTAVVVFVVMKIMPLEPTENFFLDPLYITAIIAGLVAYVAGRSRRGSFIAGTMAIVLNDIVAQLENAVAGAGSSIAIGGAGVFDAVVLSGLIALGLAEFVGETSEKISLGLKAKENETNEKKGESGPDPEVYREE